MYVCKAINRGGSASKRDTEPGRCLEIRRSSVQRQWSAGVQRWRRGLAALDQRQRSALCCYSYHACAWTDTVRTLCRGMTRGGGWGGGWTAHAVLLQKSRDEGKHR